MAVLHGRCQLTRYLFRGNSPNKREAITSLLSRRPSNLLQRSTNETFPLVNAQALTSLVVISTPFKTNVDLQDS